MAAAARRRGWPTDFVAQAVEDAVEVDVDDLVPAIERILAGGRGGAADAGIVHREVEPAIGAGGEGDHGFDLVGLGDVDGEGGRGAAGGDQRIGGGLGRIGVEIGDHDLGATGRERLDDGLADAGSATGDDRHLTREIEAHRGSPSL